MADWGKLEVAQIPPIVEQEAEAESLELPGAATVESPWTPYSVPKVPASPEKEVDAEGGDSNQVPWQGRSDEGAAGVRHLHYWVHTITETVERGNADFESVNYPLAEGVPVQVFGLDDLRSRATIILNAVDDDTTVYFGDRDVINGSAPQTTGIWLNSVRISYDYRARKEAWAVAVGGNAQLGTIAYKSEPTSGTLGRED